MLNSSNRNPSFFPKEVTSNVALSLVIRLTVLILKKNTEITYPINESFELWICVISDPIKNIR